MAELDRPIRGYVELTSPQLLDDKWRELNFDLASGQNVLQDFVMPETGAGYVYRDVKLVGSASHNRFLYWRTTNDILELVEISTETLLEDNQVRIRFVNSPIINNVNVIEFSDTIVIMFATLTSVHRIYLSHPKTTNKSVLNDLTLDVLFNPSNYYILSNQGSNDTNQPICATSWYDRSLLKCALSFPDSSILIVQFGHNTHNITTSEIKQTGIIGRLWSRMPNLWARSPNDCDNAVFLAVPYHHPETNDVLLFTLCRDCRIRVFSTNTRECVCNHNLIPQSSFSQSFASHTNVTTELPMIKISGSLIVIYLTEDGPEFVFLEHSCHDGIHTLNEKVTIQTPNWEKLIDFFVTDRRIWALANMRETESAVCFMEVKNILEAEQDGGNWDFVNQNEDIEPSSGKSLVAEIFWSNHFSAATVQKALVGIAGPSVPKKSSMESLEELAFTKIVDDDQSAAWTRFYDYCLQNHQSANKSIGLIVSEDESLVSVIKRSNPSFICPWLISDDVDLQSGPYRGIDVSSQLPGPTTRNILKSVDHITLELMTEEHSNIFEQKLYEDPANLQAALEDLIKSIVNSQERNLPDIKIQDNSAIEFICNQLDLSDLAKEFNEQILKDNTTRMRSEHNPLESNSGIILTFEVFRRLVRARMTLARDLLVLISLFKYSVDDRADSLAKSCESLYTSGIVKRLMDSLRSYAALLWLAETPIKAQTSQVNQDIINFVASKFKFFKVAREQPKNKNHQQESSLDMVLNRNLLMNFLAKGGVNFTCKLSQMSPDNQAISSSLYITEIALNICKLLWPTTDYLCLPEFLFTQQLDEQLARYLNLTHDWIGNCHDRHFVRAANCILQNRPTNAVEIFNRLWMNIKPTNLLGRFIEMGDEKPDCSVLTTNLHVSPNVIYKYFDKLIQLFQLCNNRQCLVTIINDCMLLLDENGDSDQQHWLNCLRAKLFQYHLELEDSDEAYHTMVLTTDPSLRINCLRKFIVDHCEREQWSNLLSYPFIDIKDDFIDILNQKAESLDLSKLNADDFYKTTYYDILFASYISDEEYRQAAKIMYDYSQRLAQEVPGVVSIRKQADCLLVALNSLRCAEETQRYIEYGAGSNNKEDGRSSVLKRAYDSETDSSQKSRLQSGDDSPTSPSKNSTVDCKMIEKQYELTRARLKLLEKDQTANAIALSPLKPEEIIGQLVASSMFSAAIDLALLFKTHMDPILEGLTAKYILIMRLTTVDIAVHQDIERSLTDLFTNSYSNMDTYNYVANSPSPLVDKLWRLIQYYLDTYDGVSHRYRNNEFADTFTGITKLMCIVASKLLAAGYDVPASLRRVYVSRNAPELLKLLVKYDKLAEAFELVNEMVDRIMEPASTFTFKNSNEPPPVYVPTHLIMLLIFYLNEDATNTKHIKLANALADKMNKFRNHMKTR